jgi:hypothetical protein
VVLERYRPEARRQEGGNHLDGLPLGGRRPWFVCPDCGRRAACFIPPVNCLNAAAAAASSRANRNRRLIVASAKRRKSGSPSTFDGFQRCRGGCTDAPMIACKHEPSGLRRSPNRHAQTPKSLSK